MYSSADLARLEQIVALRFLGIPLKQIGSLLDREAQPLRSTLRRQREVLEDRRRRLGLAIEALIEAERALDAGAAAAAAILQKVIRVIAMQDIDVMRKYFSDEAWAAGRQHFGDWPSREFQALYHDVAAALDIDPAGAAAQALADRWIALTQAAAKGSAVRTGLITAWVDREHWPPVLKRKIAEFNIEQAARFINQVMWIRWDAEREAQQRAGTSAPPRASERRRVLYHDCSAASLYDMDATTWDRVADFIERADGRSADL